MVQSVTESVPALLMPPPDWLVMPPEMVRPDRVAVTPESTKNTSTALLPLIERTLTPGPPNTSGPSFSESSSVLERVIVVGVAKAVGSNSISLPAGLVLALAWVIAYRNEPVSLALSLMSVTV